LGSRHEEASKGDKQATSHSAREIRGWGVRAGDRLLFEVDGAE